ncbi:peptidoglycan editing factor PgeF [Rapidithrix thailandica]|uniref:Purine nucleoside phosphorylase n=1 Tax=Rapidithrix thailandica TaxID=413964 RepID=A0AAW9S5H7_9BACT
MYRKEIGQLPLYSFENLSAFQGLKHYVSTRKGGFSNEGTFGSLNLSYNSGDDRETVTANRKKLTHALGIPLSRLIVPRQMHTDTIALVNEEVLQTYVPNHSLEATDGLLTNLPGICLSVFSADCVPVLFYDPVKRVVAAVHAGWRGTVQLIAQKMIGQMQLHFGCQASDIRVGIGPSICQGVYQVGPEVIEEVRNALGTWEGLVNRVDQEGKGYLNLWEANRLQLLQAGVLPEHIEVAEICTFTQYQTFFSARKLGIRSGRFAAGVMLVNE